MNGSNGTPEFPPQRAARHVGELAHDAITLAELQAALLVTDSRDWLRRLTAPSVLLAFSAAMLLGSIPVALAGGAYALVQLFEVPAWASLVIAAAVGLVVASCAGAIGWWKLRRSPKVFERSRDELSQNIRWVKRIVRDRSPSVGG